MTAWPARVLVNTAYAFLAAEADASDRIAGPTYIASGAESDDVEADLRRTALDAWLNESIGRDAQSERALMSYLKGA